MDLIKLFFLPIQPFVGHPERVAVVAALFFLAFVVVLILAKRVRRLRAWPLLVPTLLWTFFIPWEAYCKAGGYNIRVDLFLICPILLIATVGGIVASFKRETQTRRNTQPGDSPNDGPAPPVQNSDGSGRGRHR